MNRTEFAVRATVVLALVTGTGLVMLACWTASNALLLLFASALLAVFLRGLSDQLSARTRLGPGTSLAIVVLGLSAVTIGLGLLLAPAALVQGDDLARRLPGEVGRLRDHVAGTVWGGDWLGVHAGGVPKPVGAEPIVSQSEVFDAVAGLVGSAAQAAVAVVLIVPAGIYFAASPAVYCDGALRLLPARLRQRARDVGGDVLHRLGWWLIGQVALMAMVGTVTGLGLWALKVPLALILALLRGGLNFIPNFGPVLAIIPGLIIAAGQGSTTLAYVSVLYVVIMLVETYVMTPIVNGRTVDMAPMLLVATQLVFGELLGFPGILLAAPLTVVGMVLVQRLYLERVLGETRMEPGVLAP